MKTSAEYFYEWYWKNPERARMRKKNWRQRNPEKEAAISARRRQRLAKAQEVLNVLEKMGIKEFGL